MFMNTKTVSVSGAARRAEVTKKYIYDVLAEGRLEGSKINGVWKISAKAVEALRDRRVREGKIEEQSIR